MKVSLHSQQNRVSLKAATLRTLIRSLASRVAVECGVASWGEIAVVFTDDRGMSLANRACFGKGEPTDVITQPYAPQPGGGRGVGGEIIVNAERALAVGGPHRQGGRELALYIAHGMHHLAGAVDHTPAQRRRMLRQEQAWLRAAEREGLMNNLWTPARR